MSKEDAIKKVKEILAKDERFKDATVKIQFITKDEIKKWFALRLPQGNTKEIAWKHIRLRQGYGKVTVKLG